VCGIVGYVGEQAALDVVMSGLKRLEYRGYDSAGIAIRDDNGLLTVVRRAGKLANLEAALAQHNEAAEPVRLGRLGIGHTRWATHGAPNDRNAHPHVDCHGAVAVVHNGTLENFTSLREGLEARGHELRSETDTEAVAHLVEEAYDGDLAAAVRSVCKQLDGSFVLVVAHRDAPDVVVGARRNLPLVVGLGDGENFLASDVTAFIAHTRQAMAIDQDNLVELRRDTVRITDFEGNEVAGN
jgi:glutamine---fructose-6-phosphate transaminase (isomerizing)